MIEKQSLMQVRRENGLESRQLAEAAGVPLRVEYLAEIGGPVEEEEADKLLAALSRLTGKQYTYTSVRIARKQHSIHK